MCLFCRVGKGSPLDLPQGEKVERLLRSVRRQPQKMLALNCNCSSVYSVQNPGDGDDAGGALLNRRRDLNILRFLKMTPGQVKPAADLVEQVGEVIKSPRNFCAGESGGGEWQGCPYAGSGFYELAHRLPSGRPPPGHRAPAFEERLRGARGARRNSETGSSVQAQPL